MISVREGFDAGRLQFVHEPIVKVESFGIWFAGSLWKNARPGNGKSIRTRPDALHQPNVFLVPVVMVIGDVAGVIILYIPRLMRVRIPDRQALGILVPCALDLV